MMHLICRHPDNTTMYLTSVGNRLANDQEEVHEGTFHTLVHNTRIGRGILGPLNHTNAMLTASAMVSTELINEITKVVESKESCSFLSSEHAESLTWKIGSLFVHNTSSAWWWESLRVAFTTWEYGESDALVVLKGTLLTKADSLFLVVTDDSPPPWVVLEGTAGDLMTIIENSRVFEFFVCDNSLSWVVFDTHHNSLVFAGDIQPKWKTRP